MSITRQRCDRHCKHNFVGRRGFLANQFGVQAGPHRATSAPYGGSKRPTRWRGYLRELRQRHRAEARALVVAYGRREITRTQAFARLDRLLYRDHGLAREVQVVHLRH